MLLAACLLLVSQSNPTVDRMVTWPLASRKSHLAIPLDNGNWSVWESADPQGTGLWLSTGSVKAQSIALKLPAFIPSVGLAIGLEGGTSDSLVTLTELTAMPDASVAQEPAQFPFSFRPVMSHGGQMWGSKQGSGTDLVCLNSCGIFAYTIASGSFRVGNFRDFSHPSVLAAAGNSSLAVVLTRKTDSNYILSHKNWLWQNGKWSQLPTFQSSEPNPNDEYLMRPRIALQSGVYGDLIASQALDLDDPYQATFRQFGVGLVRVTQSGSSVLIAAPDTGRIVGEDRGWLLGYVIRREEGELIVCRISATTGEIQRLEVGLKPEESIDEMYWNEPQRSFIILARSSGEDSLRAISGVIK